MQTIFLCFFCKRGKKKFVAFFHFTTIFFWQSMKKLVLGGDEMKRRLGTSGRKRVLQNFAFSVFAEKLDIIVKTRQGQDEEEEYHE